MDPFRNTALTPVDSLKYTDKKRAIDQNNGLLLPINNEPRGSFYKLGDKYN